MIIDAHTHVQPGELPFLTANNVCCIINGATPEEWERNVALLHKYPTMLASFGLHPWHADQHDPARLAAFAPAIIGEIGMDSEWCSVDLATQRSCFIAQLELAAQLNAPVILHTKGQEKQVLDIIRNYNLVYMVHWYDDMVYFPGYAELGCYFTVPINLPQNPIAQAIVQATPLNRLLLESDGMEAIAWALGREVSPAEYLQLMHNNTEYIARVKGVGIDVVCGWFEENLERFIS